MQNVIKRLDVIIKLLLNYLNQSKERKPQMTLVSLVSQLRQLGFKNPEIVWLLG